MRSLIDAALEDQMRRVLAMSPKESGRKSKEGYGRKIQCAGVCGKWTYTSMVYASRSFVETRSWTCRVCLAKR